MAENNSLRYEFTKGLFKYNPLFVIVLGLCPSLAVTTTLKNGIAMGLAAAFVLVCSNAVISLIRNRIPKEIRIPCFIVVIASFVTMVELFIKAYFPPELGESLGIFIALIVVNCIIMYRAETFASKNPLLHSVVDGAGIGLGYTMALMLISSIREILGSGTIWGLKISEHYEPASVMIMAPGAFLLMGLILGFLKWRKERKSRKRILEYQL
ncbi:MAG TPA: electron transport complex subunit RsxE [Candidatus Brocadiia bacterium]|nr:electron transport complex subunit E [Candidatus Brocadiales bacterium]